MKSTMIPTAALVLTLVACGGSSIEEPANRTDSVAVQIDQQQRIWHATRLPNHLYTYSAIPQCDTADSFPAITVIVQNNIATSAYFTTLQVVDASTPGATKLEITGPNSRSISYVLERKTEVTSHRLRLDDIFSQISDLNREKKIDQLKFDERYGTPTSFEMLGKQKCDTVNVSISAPTPL